MNRYKFTWIKASIAYFMFIYEAHPLFEKEIRLAEVETCTQRTFKTYELFIIIA